MVQDDWPQGQVAPEGNEVAFDYVKTDDFRTVWVDGAIGGITPRGLLHIAVYSERPAIPRRQVFSISDSSEGQSLIGPEVTDKRVSRDSIVRELPVDLMMTFSAAEQLRDWLTIQIQAFSELQSK